MGALTLRLPDDKHQRLRALAKARHTTINKILDEVTMLILVDYDAETRFKLYATEGRTMRDRGLALLDKAASIGEQSHLKN